jgi:hypothetical protein
MNSKKPHATSFQLSTKAKRLLRLLADDASISMSAWLEVMIREKAKQENIK